ncbi:MAG TPA: isoleucine--tRNA ligase [Myxococcaceae bacterium]|nr:isoleucine--tRNA ligase [Myxococcaceae bacterium]
MSDASGDNRWKQTLNLPRTDFPMKGNLTQLEPRILARWDAEETYRALLRKNASAPRFVFLDGPPYANGELHAGHALNHVLKDMVVKSRSMAGLLCAFRPGWDCHGLPIEQAVEKRLRERKVDRRALSRDEFLEACRAYALEYIGLQAAGRKRMGNFALWDEPYRTLDFDYEAQELRELARIARRGLLYRRKKAVYWCITDQTALAEAEIEYEDRRSPSVYVAFRTEPGTPGLMPERRRESLADAFPALQGKAVDLVVWTTTPWTLPANLAVAVHPGLEYVFYDLGPRVIVVAKDLLPRILGEVAPEQLAVKTLAAAGGEVSAASLVEPRRILGYVTGKDLEGFAYRHPFVDRQGMVVLGDHVTLEQGTGLVHTAPGHGQEDYEVGLQYGLDIYNPVRADGRYDDTVQPPELRGVKVFDANPRIVQLLVDRGVLLNKPTDTVEHSYPHCWRCHNPIIFRATPQWFIAMDRPLDATAGLDATLRGKALSEIDQTVRWVPEWGRSRIRGMVENRPDWTLSRQRTWGVPIPVLHCEACGEAVVSSELIERVADAVEKEGTGVWYSAPLERFAPPGLKCEACGGTALRKETDILDVWFDSACAFAAVSERHPDMGLPGDLYLEGSDQHRGWFQSSLLVSVASRGHAPYREVLTAGFVVDGEGRKMSKSLGNTVKPDKLIQQHGAEIVRLWVAAADYHDDVRLSDTILRNLSEGYRKIRNTLRYALSNLYDFDPARDTVPEAELLPLDRWVLARLDDVVARVRRAYDQYEFHLVYHALVDFCGSDLSAVHFDISKDRLYTWKAAGHARRSGQTVLHRILLDVTRLLAPVTSFTAEEVWEYLPGRPTPSVFLAGLPVAAGSADPALIDTFQRLFSVRSAVQQQLEASRRDKLIGSSLEARVVLHADAEGHAFLARHLPQLPQLLIVSQVALEATPTERMVRTTAALPGAGHLGIEVRKADGAKCPRCWTYAPEVGASAEVCPKCQEALS